MVRLQPNGGELGMTLELAPSSESAAGHDLDALLEEHRG
jgi:hypothetical protein